jgi:hypothetical protein
MKIQILSLMLALAATPVFAQEIAMPQVAATIEDFMTTNGADVSTYSRSCESFDACSYMNYHTKTYAYKGDAQDAYQLLLDLGPKGIWKSSSRFELEYDPESKRFLGKDDELPALKTGQIFFLELDITKKMQIPVAFEIIELNAETRTVTFSYLKQNKSHGAQRISFHQNGENVDIIHETHFKSSSNFRDKFLYGFFHTKLLDVVWEDYSKQL